MLTAVILAMVISIVLGMGMPTVAAYVIVAALIAPALVQQFFVPDLAAHFFVLYAAILSGLTPPIAIAVVVATGIAESNFWRTAHEAMKISAPIYVLPFAFIYNPELVVGGFGIDTLFSGLIALAGALGISHGLNYYGTFFHESPFIKFPVKTVFFVLGVLAMVYPTTMGASWLRRRYLRDDSDSAPKTDPRERVGGRYGTDSIGTTRDWGPNTGSA